ncbi:MAG: alanine racemase [Candidatus Paceibacterota bacterium]|jgi:alanine racemase
MKPTRPQGLRTWLEIDRKAIKQNFETFRKLLPKAVKFLAVVKSNAYGHNLFEFAEEMEKLGADFLGVDSITEGSALRREGIKTPILILGYTLPEKLEEAVEKNISVAVSSFETLSEIKKLKVKNPIKVHIKVDTGMSRHGFSFEDSEKVIRELKSLKDKIIVEGLFTHFASAKNPAFPQFTKRQIEEYKKWVEIFNKNGFKPIRHASATSGAILFREADFDMVRIGIGLYGIWPSSEARAFAEGKTRLAPVLSWKAVIAEIKTLKAGSRVGYDCTETVAKNTKIAVIPVGYWHGLPRALSGIGRVLVGGKPCKILGRVCMDIIMLDTSEVKNAKVGDTVTIIGKSGKEEISADDISGLLDASTYELLTRINPLIKRIYK